MSRPGKKISHAKRWDKLEDMISKGLVLKKMTSDGSARESRGKHLCAEENTRPRGVVTTRRVSGWVGFGF